ncbi:MAG: patatin-like phospholipase family protein [Patescibacteria group bacterium]
MDNQKKRKNNKKIGLALGGGGAKGLAHIGVLKVLEKENIKIDFLAGTSIGSLVAAYYAAHQEIEGLEKKILKKSDWKTGLFIFDPSLKKGILKGEKIKKIISELIGVDDFQELQLPLTLTSTDLKKGTLVELSEGDLIQAIRASISVPLVFRPIKYKDMLLTDGGLADPVPDDIVSKMGAGKVIAVNLDTRYFNNGKMEEKEVKFKDISLRALNILRYHLAQQCLKDADVIIEPSIDEQGLIGWNNFFNIEKAKRIIKQGEEKTKEKLPEIKKMLRE